MFECLLFPVILFYAEWFVINLSILVFLLSQSQVHLKPSVSNVKITLSLYW